MSEDTLAAFAVDAVAALRTGAASDANSTSINAEEIAKRLLNHIADYRLSQDARIVRFVFILSFVRRHLDVGLYFSDAL